MAEGRFISYLRVSTARQGRSGLGLEAQRKAVEDFLDGGGWELIAEYVEVESGKRNGRPELQKALRHCKVTGATLICAKLDRIGRTASYVLGLLDNSGITVLFADSPHASKLELGVRAVVAEEEGRAISERTRAALARSTKPKGDRANKGAGSAALRRWRVQHGNKAGVETIMANAQRRAEDLRWAVEEMIAKGIKSNSALARELNDRAMFAPRGGLWTATSIRRLRKRLGAKTTTATYWRDDLSREAGAR